MARNPFKPTAGATPPLLLGRDAELSSYAEAIENGPGAPDLLLLATGARGVGKTVMLTALGEVAREHQWIVIDETATPGFAERIAAEADRYREQIGNPQRRKLAGISLPSVLGVGGGGVTLTPPEPASTSWRDRVRALLVVLAEHQTGLTITIDEIHAAGQEELRQLAADVQHFIREELPVSLVMAGLPQAVEGILLKGSTSVSTFLRRAERIRLLDVPIPLVAESLLATIGSTGRSIAADQAARAADATGGYPFAVQLVGYHLWRLADGNGNITPDAVTKGLDAARIRLGSLVHEPALADLSAVDRTVLVAMAVDDGPTKVSAIAERIGRDGNYVGVYRERLIAAGVIQATRWGEVDLAIPGLRDYLREHGTAHMGADSPTTDA